MIQLHIIVSGKVQGVGYRYFSQMKAVQYGITGWARNTSDGAVEIVASGKKDQLDPFIEELRRGNPFSKITNMFIQETQPTQTHNAFTIKY